MIGAEKYGQEEEEIKVEMTPEEEKMAKSIKVQIHFTMESVGRVGANSYGRGSVDSAFTCRAGSTRLKLAIHCWLPSAACMRDVWKVSLLLYSVYLYWWERQV